MHWLQQALLPNIADDARRRKGFIVVVVSSAMTLLSLFVGLLLLYETGLTFGSITTMLSILLYVACAVAAWKGFVRPAAYVLVGLVFLVTFSSLIIEPNVPASYYLTLIIMLASVALSSRELLPFALAAIVLPIFVASRASGIDVPGYYFAAMFLVMAAALAYLSAWSVEQALQAAGNTRLELEKANTMLAGANSALEERVTQRTADLQHMLVSLQQRETELQQTVDSLHSSQETIRMLSAPILPVAEQVLVAPLIGLIDSDRAGLLIHTLLSTVERESARYLIIDVTGTPLIDTQVANMLLQATQALRLLGARVILTGLRPEVAQTLVGLGVEFSGLTTRATLQSGIAEALQWQRKASTR